MGKDELRTGFVLQRRANVSETKYQLNIQTLIISPTLPKFLHEYNFVRQQRKENYEVARPYYAILHGRKAKTPV